jgi:hypothetical protein
MPSVKHNGCRATVIGDVVGSRRARDRGALHRRIQRVLDAVNAEHEPVRPLAITVGDEFQGSFEHVGQAVDAAFAVRLRLLPEVDTRYGLGWGAVEVLVPDRGIEDGPGWWLAREAIEWVATTERQAALRTVRTALRSEAPDAPDARDAPDALGTAAIAAALLCRDQLVGSLDERSLRILGGLMLHQPQTELAALEGVSGSAVSQRVRADGLAVIVAAQSELSRIR